MSGAADGREERGRQAVGERNAQRITKAGRVFGGDVARFAADLEQEQAARQQQLLQPVRKRLWVRALSHQLGQGTIALPE